MTDDKDKQITDQAELLFRQNEELQAKDKRIAELADALSFPLNDRITTK